MFTKKEKIGIWSLIIMGGLFAIIAGFLISL